MSTAWQDRYLEMRNDGKLEAQALRILGVSRRALRQLRTEDADFAEKEYEAEQNMVDQLEIEAINRATVGEPVYDKDGNQLGTKKSDPLLMFLLKGNRREKYGDKTEVKQDSELTISLRDIASEHNVDLQAAKRLALKQQLAPTVNVNFGEF